MKFSEVKEGKAKLLVSKGEKISKDLPVFYNSEKEFDRDLSVLLLRATKKKTVLDLMAASGARGIRLAKEAGCKVIFNDVNSEAIKILKKNIKLNKIESKSKIFNMTANRYLAQSIEKFDFVDIDPFGSPINFVFNSIPRLEKDGILAVTATDTAPLYGVFRYKCMKKYGSVPYHTKTAHEIGLRILAKAVIEQGAKWNVSLTPIFAHATKHYYRIYFQHKRSYVDELMKQIGFIHYCEKCKHRFTSGFNFEQKCDCGGHLRSAGPLWLGNLWNEKLIKDMIAAQEKLKWGTKYNVFLKTLLGEAKIKIPFHFETVEFIEKEEPKFELLLKKIKSKKFKATRTHFAKKGIRTDATIKQLREIFK